MLQYKRKRQNCTDIYICIYVDSATKWIKSWENKIGDPTNFLLCFVLAFLVLPSKNKKHAYSFILRTENKLYNIYNDTRQAPYEHEKNRTQLKMAGTPQN